MLSCMSSSYTLDVNPLLVISFTNNFSHLVGCLFALFMVSFAVQKTLSVIRSYFFNFCFHFLCTRENYIPKIDIIYVKYLGKEMAIHSTTLAWKIPRTEERGRLQSTGSQSRTRLSNFTFCNYHWLPNIPQIFGSAFEVIAEASPKCLSALIHVPP